MKMVLVSSCYVSFTACSTGGGFDDDSVNQRSFYRDDDTRSLLPTPEQATAEARQYRLEEEKNVAQRKGGADSIAGADGDGTLDDAERASMRDWRLTSPRSSTTRYGAAEPYRIDDLRGGRLLEQEPEELGRRRPVDCRKGDVVPLRVALHQRGQQRRIGGDGVNFGHE